MTHDLIGCIKEMTPGAVSLVCELEREAGVLPPAHIETQHTFHAGMYARTVMVPQGVLITGALIKIPTILVVSGSAIMYGGDGPDRIDGYAVFSAEAGRKQAFLALEDTHLTMCFPTDATTVEDAEQQFTEEVDKLITRRDSFGGAIV